MFNNNKFDKKHLEEVLIKPKDLDPDMGVPKASSKITTFEGVLKRLNVLPTQPALHGDDTQLGKEKHKKKKKKRTKTLKQLRKAKKKLNKCWKRFIIFVNSVKAFFSRVLYILHALLSIWRVTVVIGEWYWVIGSWLLFMVVEAGIVMFKRHGKEWKWIQPCILIYLMVELPSIWMLELVKLNEVQTEKNISNPILNDILTKHKNSGKGQTDVSVAGLTISNDWWALLLEQSMLVLIIIARWLMPKGDMTRDQLSALLLFYLGTASDIVDFFSVVSEDADLSATNYTFLFTVMIFWSWSMFQFVFLVTMTKEDDEGEKTEEDGKKDEHHEDMNGSQENLLKPTRDAHKVNILGRELEEENLTFKQKAIINFKIFLASEVWAILVSVIFQDGPYAIVRVICVFYWNIRTYTNYFFTFKNIMILILQIYRLISVYEEHVKTRKEQRKKRREERKRAWREAILQATHHGDIDHSTMAEPVGSARSGILRRREVNKNITTTDIGGSTISQSLKDNEGHSGFNIVDGNNNIGYNPTSRWSFIQGHEDNSNSDSGNLTSVSVL